MTQRYIAITPNRDYNGKTYGVRFENGKAIFDDLTVNADLGLSAEEIAIKMVKELSYTVTDLEGKPVVVPSVVAAGPVTGKPAAPQPVAAGPVVMKPAAAGQTK